ncbi:MAG TPA: hypothetical protein PK449_07815 [Exilispira sp.]|nr:hypothetical protein [Exilispira sp.]
MKSINKLAGVFAPLIFCLSFTLQGILREDYDPVKMYISAYLLENMDGYR